MTARPGSSGRFPSPRWRIEVTILKRLGSALIVTSSRLYRVSAKKAETAMYRALHSWRTSGRHQLRHGRVVQLHAEKITE